MMQKNRLKKGMISNKINNVMKNKIKIVIADDY